MKYDYLIVGSGLFGSTFAYLAKQKGKRCLVIEKRNHIGGNVYTENVKGITVHKYGAHIFHTSDEEVWNFVNSLLPFNRYTNSPIACYKGNYYNLPFNMNTFYQMWHVLTPEDAKKVIDEQTREAKQRLIGLGITEPRNLEEQALCLIGKDIYEKLIKEYTEKQWGRKCNELPAFIIKRLPFRLVWDNNYFNDRFQGIPIGGYTKLIEKMLEDSDVMLNVDYFSDSKYYNSLAEKIVFTGKIDEFYEYRYGKLKYRTVRFEQELLDIANYQGNAVVNYTDSSVPYTRIIEHKHFEYFGNEVYSTPFSVISREYSQEWQDGLEPYYPINDEENSILNAEYQKLANNESNVIFGGRLAEYKYYDMGPIIRKAIDYWK